MLVTENLTRQYGDRRALDGVSLRIEPGSFVGVIGRSGAGKSTLLRLLNRLAEPSSGRILHGGTDVTALKGRPLRDWRARCAMIFQQFNLVGRLDVMTNVLTGRLSHVPSHRALLRLWPEADRAMALAALDQFGMGEFAAIRADQLSGGQQQRVAIARALVQEPEIILADEPVASLDPRNTRLVMDALSEVNKRYGITVICNLHSLDLARAYCDRLVGLVAGRVVFDGGPSISPRTWPAAYTAWRPARCWTTSRSAAPSSRRPCRACPTPPSRGKPPSASEAGKPAARRRLSRGYAPSKPPVRSRGDDLRTERVR